MPYNHHTKNDLSFHDMSTHCSASRDWNREGQKQKNPNPSFCPDFDPKRPPLHRDKLGRMLGPHVGTSAYVSQSPCDVQYVRNLYVNGSSDTRSSGGDAVSALLCVEDVLTAPQLVQAAHIAYTDTDTGTDTGTTTTDTSADSGASTASDTDTDTVKETDIGRLHSDWAVHASSRGLASLWYVSR